MATREPNFMPFWDFDCPYIQEVYEFTDDTIVFNGYFRIESQTCPVRRIMESSGVYYWIEILTKEELQDTSQGFYDPDVGGTICLTPTAKIKITYQILETLDTEEKLFARAEEREKSKEEEKRRNCEFKNHSEEMEHQSHLEFCKTLEYHKLLKKDSVDKPE
jgi:hypothetical protein